MFKCYWEFGYIIYYIQLIYVRDKYREQGMYATVYIHMSEGLYVYSIYRKPPNISPLPFISPQGSLGAGHFEYKLPPNRGIGAALKVAGGTLSAR
jgi:hypothetical protein